MQPFILDKDFSLSGEMLSSFQMHPGKVYFTKCRRPDELIKMLQAHGIKTHRIGETLTDIDSLSYFEKRKQVSKLLNKRGGDANYFIKYFYFLPKVTAGFVRFYDQTASKLLGFEYYYHQLDIFLLSLSGIDERGKSSIFTYLRNRELHGKIVIVIEANSVERDSSITIEEWKDDYFDEFIPERRPRYPHDTSATETFPDLD